MEYAQELRIARRAALEAGKYLLKKFRKPHSNNVSFKEKREIVTDSDIGAEKIIRKILMRAFPEDSILGEELGSIKNNSNRLWLVDPLDGTNNFAHGIPIFAVCIALAENNNLKAGTVYLPYFKELFWAVKGRGAYLEKEKLGLSKVRKLGESFILQCHGSGDEHKEKYYKILKKIKFAAASTRRLGAAGYEFTAAARGHVEGGFIVGTRPWDSAAGALILREAGGRVTNFKGKEWDIRDSDVVFSNGKIHGELLKLIKL